MAHFEDIAAVRAAMNVGNREVALQLLQKILETDRMHGEAWYLLAQLVENAEQKRVCIDNASKLGYYSSTIKSKGKKNNLYKDSMISKIVEWALGILLTVVVLVLIATMYISKMFGGFKVYNASTTTEFGKAFATQENTEYKYICERVFGVFYADFLRFKCHFVVHFSRQGDEYKYNIIKDEYIQQLGLKPDFSWWELNGWPFAIILCIITITILVLLAKSGGSMRDFIWGVNLAKDD